MKKIILVIAIALVQGCTLKIDNPFYEPASLDVNKTQSAMDYKKHFQVNDTQPVKY